ncbi:MAG: TonB-dependent receptor, partial [Pseudomonadota bacterium]
LNSALLTDVEASPINFVNFRSLGETKMFTQELRASGQTDRLSWTAGLYFLDIKADVTNGFLAPANSLFLPFAGFADFFEPGLDLLNNFEFDTTSYSLFGQVEYQISDQWTVLLGGRIIYEEQDYFLAQGGFANVDDFEADTATLLFPAPSTLEDLVNAPNFSPFEDNRDNTLWVGKVQIEYRPNDDTLLFAGISRGAKGGAYNAPLLDGSPPLAAEQIGYDPESLLSYEAGLKSTLLDGLLQVNASIFYYDYNDYQEFTFVNVSGIVSNQDARTYGGEIDIIANPYEGLFIGIGYGYFDNKVKDLPVAPAVFDPEDGSLVAPAVLRDVESTFSPQSQFSARVNYDLPFDAAGGVINLGAVVSTNSSYFHNLRNFSAHEIDGFTIANLRATWTNEEAGITLAAFVNNVFDKRYVNVGFDLSGLCDCTEESYGAPRQWGLEARFNF